MVSRRSDILTKAAKVTDTIKAIKDKSQSEQCTRKDEDGKEESVDKSIVDHALRKYDWRYIVAGLRVVIFNLSIVCKIGMLA